ARPERAPAGTQSNDRRQVRPKVSVVFVNYNSTALLERAASSLRQAEPELRLELIVVDNASKDLPELRRACGRLGVPIVRLSGNAGYGRAANRGVRRATGEFVVVGNTDLRFRGRELSRLVAALRENAAAGVVSPQFVYPGGCPQPSARRYPRLRYALGGRRSVLARFVPRFGHRGEFLYEGIHRADMPVGVEAIVAAFAVFRREAFDAVGGFDERYRMFAEDMDICRRLRAAGWDVLLDPRVRVEHYYGGVRRSFARFSDYQRVRALRQFMSDGRGPFGRAALSVLAFGYFAAVEAGRLAGLTEFEQSWQAHRGGA
ncbi:MAG: glycosyltransferase family 2 protein, partial [bacterium]